MAKQAGERVLSLDGLRGLGALTVLLYHIGIMLLPFGPGLPYALIPGSASVMVFFVLSGAVLALAPFKRLRGDAGYDWFGYFPRRIIRLGVPLVIAIAFGVIAGFVAWRIGSTSRSALAIDFAGGPVAILHDVFMQFDVLFNVSDGATNLLGAPLARVNSPVWSMSWEIWFSLTLPLAVWCVARIRRVALSVAVIFAAIFLSHLSGYFPLRLCLMFWLGVLVARHFDELRTIRIPAAMEALLLAAILVAIELPFGLSSSGMVGALLATLMNAACALLVVVSVCDGFVRRALSTLPMLFLGKISYSLYLTHAILIGGLDALMPHLGVADPLAISIVSLAGSFALALVFWRLVERPSMAWSHAIGAPSPNASGR